MAQKNEFIEAIDALPWIVKLILCIPALDIVWSIYRIIKYASPVNGIMLLISIVMCIGSFTIGWILDVICVIMNGKPFLG